MRHVSPPDIVAFFLFAAVTTVSVLFVMWAVWPLVSSSQWRLVAVSAATLVGALFPIWWLSGTRARQWVHFWYYRMWGPTCELEITSVVELDGENVEDNLVLDQKLEKATQEWRKDAKLFTGNSNRGVIRAGPITVTYNISSPVDFGDSIENEYEELDPAPRNLELTISGYKGRISGVLADLNGEVGALLGRLLRLVVVPERQPTLVLKATLTGRNTFLSYHLPGVRPDRIESFRLRLNDRTHGDLVNVQVNDNVLTVGSRSQDAMVKCAARYLATPDLANVDKRRA